MTIAHVQSRIAALSARLRASKPPRHWSAAQLEGFARGAKKRKLQEQLRIERQWDLIQKLRAS